jgi:hypothetical protein
MYLTGEVSLDKVSSKLTAVGLGQSRLACRIPQGEKKNSKRNIDKTKPTRTHCKEAPIGLGVPMYRRGLH